MLGLNLNHVSKIGPWPQRVYILRPKQNVLHCINIVFNSLAPGRCQFNFRYVIFKRNLVNGGWGISYEIALRWMPLDLTDDKSTLIQVMAWCRQATSHYLSQCWPRSMSPNGVTRPQWVKCISFKKDFDILISKQGTKHTQASDAELWCFLWSVPK